MAKSKTTETLKTLEAAKIRRPDMRTAVVEVKGTGPYVQNRFSEKAQQQMIADQGGVKGEGRRARRAVPKDAAYFRQCFQLAQHISEKGWVGMPASAFRSALIRAISLVPGAPPMTRAKCSLWILPDGFGKTDQTPLVRINGKPEMDVRIVRNSNGSPDTRARPMFKKWSATLHIQYDAYQFALEDIYNLLERAGLGVGIGEGRNDSKNSCGMGWGSFTVVGRTRKNGNGSRKRAA